MVQVNCRGNSTRYIARITCCGSASWQTACSELLHPQRYRSIKQRSQQKLTRKHYSTDSRISKNLNGFIVRGAADRVQFGPLKVLRENAGSFVVCLHRVTPSLAGQRLGDAPASDPEVGCQLLQGSRFAVRCFASLINSSFFRPTNGAQWLYSVSGDNGDAGGMRVCEGWGMNGIISPSNKFVYVA